MTAEKKLAQKRLTLLQLAEKLGNVSKACRMHKVSRSQFYEYKRSFQEYGLEGLIDRPPIAASHSERFALIRARASCWPNSSARRACRWCWFRRREVRFKIKRWRFMRLLASG